MHERRLNVERPCRTELVVVVNMAVSLPPTILNVVNQQCHDPVAYYTPHDDHQHVVYRAANGHLFELAWAGTTPQGFAWDLTAAAGATPAARKANALSAYYSPTTNTKHVVYLGTDGHIHDLWWVPAVGTPASFNLTQRAGRPRGLDKSIVAFALPTSPSEHVVYREGSSIIELLY